jgi:hypothetical protein
MARNPWLKISPTQQIAKNSDGNKLVYGNIGKIISHGWILGQLILLFIGFEYLRRFGQSEKFYANLIALPIIVSWLISIGTIGDHRFRVPTMALSLLLQVAGFMVIKGRVVRVL